MSKSVRTCILLICALALASRVAGMHMHVSADHDAAPSMHIVDVGSDYEFHHDHQPDPGQIDPGHDSDHDADAHSHADEVSLDPHALSKKLDGDRDAGVWLMVATLLFFLPAPRDFFVSQRTAPDRKLKRTPYLLPPLRGPPLNA